MKFWVTAIILFFAANAASAVELSTSGALVEEVLAQAEDAKAYDWRRMTLQLDLQASFVYEGNVFQSRSYGLGAFHSLGRGWLLHGALRRAQTLETTSSQQMALTIYSQAAQPSRFELLLGGGYMLLDGRSSTVLNPRLTDLGHALIALAGVHYNHFDNRDPAPIAGMRAIYYDLVAEVGLRFQIFLPHSLGVAFEWTYERPLRGADPELTDWQRFGGSLSWSFGE